MKATQLLASELERNLACVLGGQIESRRRNIRQMTNKLHLASELVLLGVSLHLPDLVGSIVGIDTRPKGYYFVGGGHDHTVISDGRVVTKINRDSVLQTEAARQNMAERMNREHRLMCRYLGGLLVEQTTIVDAHPLNSHKRAVQTLQDIVEFEPLTIFHPHKPEIGEAALEQTVAAHPAIEGSLHELAERSLQMAEETGLLLDVSGLDNIVITKDRQELKCIDGLPLHADNKSDRTRIGGQLRQLLKLTDRSSHYSFARPAAA